MSLNAPASAIALAYVDPPPVADPPVELSRDERYLGVRGSTRRLLATFSALFVASTAIREVCFMPGVFGNTLLRNLGPLERETVQYYGIAALRAWDFAVLLYLWPFSRTKDSWLFGAAYALVTRLPVYVFENSYFLLSVKTTTVLLLTDVAALSIPCLLLPSLLPARPRPYTKRPLLRLLSRPELASDLFVAFVTQAALLTAAGYAAPRLGAATFLAKYTKDLTVPAAVAKAALSPAQILARPELTVPTLRGIPDGMPLYAARGGILSAALLALALLLPSVPADQLAVLASLLTAVPVAGMVPSVLPVALEGAAGVAVALGVTVGLVVAAGAVLISELREELKSWDRRPVPAPGSTKEGAASTGSYAEVAKIKKGEVVGTAFAEDVVLKS